MALGGIAGKLTKKTLINEKGFKGTGGWMTKFNNKIFTLVHYNTPILEVDIVSREAKILGGYSMSDAQGINNSLQVIGINKTATISQGKGLRFK